MSRRASLFFLFFSFHCVKNTSYSHHDSLHSHNKETGVFKPEPLFTFNIKKTYNTKDFPVEVLKRVGLTKNDAMLIMNGKALKPDWVCSEICFAELYINRVVLNSWRDKIEVYIFHNHPNIVEDDQNNTAVDNSSGLSLARPKPFFVAKGFDALLLFKKIKSIIAKNSFDVIEDNSVEGVLRARREVDKREYEEILIWLGRDFREPDDVIWVFFEVGTFAKAIIGESCPCRVKSDIENERERIDPLKNEISDTLSALGAKE